MFQLDSPMKECNAIRSFGWIRSRLTAMLVKYFCRFPRTQTKVFNKSKAVKC